MIRLATKSIQRSLRRVRPAVSVGVAACAFAASGCASGAQGAAVSLDCEARLEGGGLHVEYTVRNQSGVDIAILNRVPLPASRGPDGFPADTVYIDREGAELRVSKMALPIPPGLSANARIIPFASRLETGREFQERFQSPAPIVVYNPLRHASLVAGAHGGEVVADDPQRVSVVVCSIGVVPLKPGIELRPVSREYPGVFRLWPPGPAVDSQIVLTRKVRLTSPVAVLDYRVRRR